MIPCLHHEATDLAADLDCLVLAVAVQVHLFQRDLRVLHRETTVRQESLRLDVRENELLVEGANVAHLGGRTGGGHCDREWF